MEMKTYHFTVIAEGLDPDADGTYNAFFEAGCDDAEISWVDGHFSLEFHREAARFDEAVISAYRDATKAGATVTRFEPDSLVTMSEIAERSGLALSVLSDLRASDEGAPFPAPIVRISAEDPLWDWAAVTMWLQQCELISRDVAIEARILWEANTTLLLQTMLGADFEQAFSGLATR